MFKVALFKCNFPF